MDGQNIILGFTILVAIVATVAVYIQYRAKHHH